MTKQNKRRQQPTTTSRLTERGSALSSSVGSPAIHRCSMHSGSYDLAPQYTQIGVHASVIPLHEAEFSFTLGILNVTCGLETGFKISSLICIMRTLASQVVAMYKYMFAFSLERAVESKALPFKSPYRCKTP